jgi:hypothetical protein
MQKWSILLIFVLLFPCLAFGASVSLNWERPVFSCDGSTLDDLAGYIIMWGTRPGGPYPNMHNVDNPAATSATVNVGSQENTTLYFVSVSVDTSGNRSDDLGGCGTSNEVSVTLESVAPSPPTGLSVMIQ